MGCGSCLVYNFLRGIYAFQLLRNHPGPPGSQGELRAQLHGLHPGPPGELRGQQQQKLN